MTIAIGTRFDDGVIVCADTKIVSTDGSTTTGSKAFMAQSSNQLVCAVANAADDGLAAKMLASDIAYSVGSCLLVRQVGDGKERYSWPDLSTKVKKTMTDWYSAFGAVKPPGIHFLLACGGGGDCAELYFCEPPNTVLGCFEPMAIGQGARPIDNVMPKLFRPCSSGGIKGALLKLAFLMHRAKSEEGAACGGESTTIVITKRGRFTFVSREEMKVAEQFTQRVGDLADDFRKTLLSGTTQSAEGEIATVTRKFLEMSKEAEEIDFPSLRHLEHPTPWEKGR